MEPALQVRILNVLQTFSRQELANHLIDRWRQLAPVARPVAVNLLLRRRAWHLPMIEAVEQGRIGPGELNLDLEQRRRLRRHSSEAVQVRARAMFGDEEYSNRAAFLNDWMKDLPAEGKRDRGLSLFVTHCAACHRYGEMGHDVVPSLNSLSHRSIEDLAYNILDPNMAINPKYGVAEVETKDGELLRGILTHRDRSGIRLLMAQGIRTSVASADIRSLVYAEGSLMPSGWEDVLSPQDLRDVIRLLRHRDGISRIP